MKSLKFTSDKVIDGLRELRYLKVDFDYGRIYGIFEHDGKYYETILNYSHFVKHCDCDSFLFRGNCKHLQLLSWIMTHWDILKIEVLRRFNLKIEIIRNGRTIFWVFGKGRARGRIIATAFHG